MEQAYEYLEQTDGYLQETSSAKRPYEEEYEDLDGKRCREGISGQQLTLGYSAVLASDEGEARAGRVLHIRSFPNDVTEGEVLGYCIPFGKVVGMLLMRSSGQALVEMESAVDAASLVHHYNSSSFKIRHSYPRPQVSKHTELSLKPDQVERIAPLIKAQPRERSPCVVLHAVVNQLTYPVNVDTYHQIFSRYGTVLKIATYEKGKQFHGFVQFPDSVCATAAKFGLDGQYIYTGCNQLRVDFSSRSEVKIMDGDPRCRDFTKPQGPMQSRGREGLLPMEGLLGHPNAAPFVPSMPPPPAFRSTDFSQSKPEFEQRRFSDNRRPSDQSFRPAETRFNDSQNGFSPVVLVSNLDPEKIGCDDLFVLFGSYGDVIRVKMLFKKPGTAMVQFATPDMAQTVSGPVVAMRHLNRVMLIDREIVVSISKHMYVSMPLSEDELKKDLTKDFTDSPAHRFKKPGSKNFQNIFPPRPTLHVSNFPEGTSDTDLIQLFTSTGGKVDHFKFFPNDNKMALVQMGSTQDAILCLMTCSIGTACGPTRSLLSEKELPGHLACMKVHNIRIGDHHLRVSFARNNIQ